jgi:hypothetical protein
MCAAGPVAIAHPVGFCPTIFLEMSLYGPKAKSTDGHSHVSFEGQS